MLSHFCLSCFIVAFNKDFLPQFVDHPKTVAEPMGWRTAEVASGIALSWNQQGLNRLGEAIGIGLRAGAEARAKVTALALTRGSSVAKAA